MHTSSVFAPKQLEPLLTLASSAGPSLQQFNWLHKTQPLPLDVINSTDSIDGSYPAPASNEGKIVVSLRGSQTRLKGTGEEGPSNSSLF